MKNYIISGIIVILLAIFWFYTTNPLTTTVKIAGHTFTVDLAITGKEKELGLGGRVSMPAYYGMLFPYDHKDTYHFWMKGMRIPLDIIWIEDNTIVDISKNVPVPTGNYLPNYAPSVPVNKILELNAGTTDRLGIKIGDIVTIKN